jgi:hypothetical protein
MRSAILLATAIGCSASASLPPVRFANAPVVAVVDDRRDVPAQPATRTFWPHMYFYDASFRFPVTRTLELPRPRRALGVNALDDVPDSTWFTNRIGARALTHDEIVTGPITDNPTLHLPWTVRSTKTGGTTVGLVVKDARGVKYLIKFDDIDAPPELETGTHVVVNRLLWACGYNVPEDQVVYIDPDKLVLAPDAVVKDRDGHDARRFERAELERFFTKVRHEPDGRVRAVASRWIDGKTIGGHPGEGVRRDDPNDRIPHELRRDLRGQYAIYAWLDAVDVTEGQFVDTWIADSGDPKRHYVEHYAVDFGKSLGAMGAILHDWWYGHAYRIDFPNMLRKLVSFGAEPRPWQERDAPPLRGVAKMLDVATFDPGSWHPDTPGYTPFRTADRVDKFWGAKIVARFTRDQIHAAVEAGQFSDPRAVDYITDALVGRQRATAAYWFARTNPLDRFEVAATAARETMCFDDLAIEGGYARAGETHYAITGYDFHATRTGERVELAADASGRTCAIVLPLAPRDDDGGYTILRIATTRPGFTGETLVHVARDPSSGAPRVIGVWRP